MSRRSVVALMLGLVFASAFVALRAAGGVAADPRSQRGIEQVVQSIVVSGRDANVGEIEAGIERLAETAGSRSVLLLQLAFYLSRADGTERAMGGALLLDYLRFTPGEIASAVLPELGTDDPALLGVFHDLLRTVDRAGHEDPDFDPYLGYLSQVGPQPPTPVVRYLYGVSPAEGLAALTAVYSREPGERARILGAAEVILAAAADAPPPQAEIEAALDALSRNDAWWVRLFVARALQANPRLDSPLLAARLESDRHPLVRESTVTGH